MFEMAETIEVLVDGGKASAGPPLGPALGPMGLNIMQVVRDINEKTKAFAGMKVPVKLTIDSKTKKYEISVGTPPASALILKELGVPKGSGNARTDKVGNLTLEQVKKIAAMKETSLLGNSVKARSREIIGTCASMGVTIEGKEPVVILKEIAEGKHDDAF